MVYVGRHVGHFVQQDAFSPGEGEGLKQDPAPLFVAVAGHVSAQVGGHPRHDERVVDRDPVGWQRISKVAAVEPLEVALILLFPFDELCCRGGVGLAILPR